MKMTRKYSMGARAEQVEETRRRILAATIDLAGRLPFTDISLDAVATEAGVSVQTLLRRFGSRDALIAAAMEVALVDVEDERRTAPGDAAGAVRTVIDHYERRGRTALLMLAQESHDDVARKATDRGKALHRDWVREAFAPLVTGLAEDDAALDLLVVATDVYAWKLLRLDRGLSRAVTERRLIDLVTAVLAAHATAKEK